MVEPCNEKANFANRLQMFEAGEMPKLLLPESSYHSVITQDQLVKNNNISKTMKDSGDIKKEVQNCESNKCTNHNSNNFTKNVQWPHLASKPVLGLDKPIPSLINKPKKTADDVNCEKFSYTGGSSAENANNMSGDTSNLLKSSKCTLKTSNVGVVSSEHTLFSTSEGNQICGPIHPQSVTSQTSLEEIYDDITINVDGPIEMPESSSEDELELISDVLKHMNKGPTFSPIESGPPPIIPPRSPRPPKYPKDDNLNVGSPLLEERNKLPIVPPRTSEQRVVTTSVNNVTVACSVNLPRDNLSHASTKTSQLSSSELLMSVKAPPIVPPRNVVMQPQNLLREKKPISDLSPKTIVPPPKSIKNSSNGMKPQQKSGLDAVVPVTKPAIPVQATLSSADDYLPMDSSKSSLRPLPLKFSKSYNADFKDDVVNDDMGDNNLISEERLMSNFTLSLLSCGGDELYQKYHTKAVISDLLDEDDYVLPEDECETIDKFLTERLYDDITNQNSDIYSPVICEIADDVLPPAVLGYPKKISNLITCIEKTAGMRTMWSKMPEVMQSGIINTLSTKEIRLQECIFEILSSEASYYNSLVLLCDHFMKNLLTNTSDVEAKMDRHYLFSNVEKVCSVSDEMLQLLQIEWSRNIILNAGSIAQLIKTFAEEHFKVYERYCSNEVYQQRTLSKLKMINTDFRETLEKLENDIRCQKLDLQSFLALPFQRMTRLPLLFDVILRNLDKNDSGYQAVEQCLRTLQKIVKNCNESKRHMENIEQVAQIRNMLDFSKVKLAPIGSQQLVKKGSLTRIYCGNTSIKKMLAKKKEPVFFFLLSNLLIITKRRSEKSYEVVDHVARKLTDVKTFDSTDCPKEVHKQHNAAFLLALLDEHKCSQYILMCETESERERWIQAFTPVNIKDDEVYYESWDRPQVQAIQRYITVEPDELALEEGDVVTVIKKHKDGMYEGQRIRDGERGWFPSSVTKEIVGEHAKARNLRMWFRFQKLFANDDVYNMQ